MLPPPHMRVRLSKAVSTSLLDHIAITSPSRSGFLAASRADAVKTGASHRRRRREAALNASSTVQHWGDRSAPCRGLLRRALLFGHNGVEHCLFDVGFRHAARRVDERIRGAGL